MILKRLSIKLLTGLMILAIFSGLVLFYHKVAIPVPDGFKSVVRHSERDDARDSSQDAQSIRKEPDISEHSEDKIDEYTKWQQEAGYIRPKIYENMTKQELAARSLRGDKFASQKLGEMAWHELGDREAAVNWMKRSAEQGSVAALTQAALMFDPDSDVMLAHRARFGAGLKGDRVEAYIWARLAAMRGDPDALFGVAKHSKHLERQQITQLEFLATEQYRQLQQAHIQLTGRGFVNNYPTGRNMPHEQIIKSERY